MSAEWKGDLRNTASDVLIDSALLLLSVCAYIPQISRLRNGTSTRGISAYYVLSSIFFSNSQLSEVLLDTAYAWPTAAHPMLERINNGSMNSVEILGAVLGLLQIFVQWSCSIAVLMSFAPGTQRNVGGGSITALAFAHTSIVLVPALALALPKPSSHTFAKDILMALIGMSNLVVAPCFVVLQFYAQFWEMRAQNGNPGALSLLSIGLQAPIIAALGFRWFLRLGKPTWGNAPAPMWLWYEWSFPAANYAIHGMGCFLLLACYLFAALRSGRMAQSADSDARVPLLR